MDTARKTLLGMLLTNIVLLVGTEKVFAQKTKVVTIVENVTLSPGQTIEPEPLRVSTFQKVSFLGFGSHTSYPDQTITFSVDFITEPVGGLVPRLSGGPCSISQYTDSTSCAFAILGPYLDLKIFNPQPGYSCGGGGCAEPITFTLKAYLQ